MDTWIKWRDERERRRKDRGHQYRYTTKKVESILILERKWFTDKTTIGPIAFDGEYICDILEDTIRDPNKDGILQKEEKVYGETAIPSGRYEIVLAFSPKFQKELPMLLDVPYYSYIYIHCGNRDTDTLGCLLTGTRSKDVQDLVYGSRTAFKKLMPLIEGALEIRQLFIEVRGGPTA